MGWFSSSKPEQEREAEASSMDGSYKPMKRNERKHCWDARDQYFACLDRHEILDAQKDEKLAAQKCGKEGEIFERDCAISWVKYFKAKRVADYEKEQQMKKLEAEGAVPMQSSQQSKWKFW